MRAESAAFIVLAALALGSLSGHPAQAEGPAPHPVGEMTETAATQFHLDGLVMTPADYDREALGKLPRTSITVGKAVYSGVSLWALLSKADIVTRPEIKNGILRGFIVATASDGYKLVISLGEIDPDFGNQPCLIATQKDGADFTSGGFAQLVFPNDVKKGRWVRGLTGLKVSEAP